MLLQMAMCLMTLLSITLNLLLTQITLLAAVPLLLYNIRTMNRLSENPMIRIHLLAMSAALRMLALLMWMLRPWMVTLLQWKLRHLQVTLIERSILMTKRQAMLALTMLNLLLTLAALERTLPHGTESDIYRIRLTGTPEEPPRLPLLQEALAERFFALQLRDETSVRREVWDRCGEDTLRGLFLEELRRQYDAAPDDDARRRIEQAARFGAAARTYPEIPYLI